VTKKTTQLRDRKKQLKQDYQQRVPSIGVFQIRNTNNEKILLVAGKDLRALFNRHRFQLQKSGHPNKALQEDWQRFGENTFAFEIIEEVTPPAGLSFDMRRELETMENLWLAELNPFGERGYNQPKLSRAERLRRLASKRSD
jgi:hypothetical protein